MIKIYYIYFEKINPCFYVLRNNTLFRSKPNKIKTKWQKSNKNIETHRNIANYTSKRALLHIDFIAL